MSEMKITSHPAQINPNALNKARRHAARLSRLHQAIAQKGHTCPVEDLHAEIDHHLAELKKMGHAQPGSHQEAARLWHSLDPENPHAHHATLHNEHGHRIVDDEGGE